MRVGMIGLGKLGLPVATAMAARGLEVVGFDPHVSGYPDDLSYEDGFAESVDTAEGRVRFCETVGQVVDAAKVVFVAVQTPHEPRFEGVTPLPEERADFDYSYLRDAVAAVAHEAELQRKHLTISVISTVLPGTTKREVEPLLGEYVSLVYNPSFIAMGTTIRDFLDPEFVLLGGDGQGKVRAVYDFIYADQQKVTRRYTGGHLHMVPFYDTTVPNAELIKVAYNTFIGLKLAFANTLMEVCHKTDCDVDEVTGALKLADRRLISGAYLDGGMGDGGGCHPRDNIALSWLARELDLSYDLFEAAMEQRQAGTDWLCDLVWAKAQEHDLPICILGTAYKPNSHIETGSPARLAKVLLYERFDHITEVAKRLRAYDPHTEDFQGSRTPPVEPHVFLVGCRHPEFPEMELPEGSVVIDPWRYMPDREGVEVIRIGAQ
jgi:UDPglucose 6-dehydrogenase